MSYSFPSSTLAQTLSESYPLPRPSGIVTQLPTNFAFLVHNQASIASNLGPNIDNKPLVRQRRHRTSPEDYVILEAEFSKNPKPDREARKSIVERVSLGDKEVHIWFQNRRQKYRRKGTSLPNEDSPSFDSSFGESIPASQQDFSRSLSSQPSSSPTLGAPPPASSSAIGDVMLKEEQQSRQSVECVGSGNSVLPITIESPKLVDSEGRGPTDIEKPETKSVLPVIDIACQVEDRVEGPSASSLAEVTMPVQLPVEASSPASDVTTADTSLLLATQSDGASDTPPSSIMSSIVPPPVKLSFNSEGGACLLPETEATPSPPRPNPTAPTPFTTRQSLRRSYSAAGLSDFRASVHSLNSTTSSQTETVESTQERMGMAGLLQRRPAGRSRDSRAWEFWCDSTARNELANTAEKDTEGNARHAIGLLRSRSSSARRSSVLTPSSSSKANSSTQTKGYPAEREPKRTKLAGQKPKTGLKRAHTVSGPPRFPMQDGLGLGIFVDGANVAKSPERTLRSPPGESAKENRGFEALRRHHQGGKPQQRRRPVLTESYTAPPSQLKRTVLSATMVNGHVLGRSKSPLKTVEGRTKERFSSMDPEKDEELARFMGRGREEGATGDADDLAVQGLLSLSQGNWR